MRVPPISVCGFLGVKKSTHSLKPNYSMIKPIENDTVSFSSQSKYYRLYTTLPDEIKSVLPAEDSVAMFQNMEDIADGMLSGNKIAAGFGTDVYENPWLDDYYIMISKDLDDETKVIYTKTNMGNLAWQDPNDDRLQLMRKES